MSVLIGFSCPSLYIIYWLLYWNFTNIHRLSFIFFFFYNNYRKLEYTIKVSLNWILFTLGSCRALFRSLSTYIDCLTVDFNPFSLICFVVDVIVLLYYFRPTAWYSILYLNYYERKAQVQIKWFSRIDLGIYEYNFLLGTFWKNLAIGTKKTCSVYTLLFIILRKVSKYFFPDDFTGALLSPPYFYGPWSSDKKVNWIHWELV